MNINKVKTINKELGFKKGYEWKQNKRLTKDFLSGETYCIKSYIDKYFVSSTGSLYVPEIPKHLIDEIKPETDKFKEELLRDKCLNIYKDKKSEFKPVESFYTLTVELDTVPEIAGHMCYYDRKNGDIENFLAVPTFTEAKAPGQFAFFTPDGINLILSWHPDSKFFMRSFLGYKCELGFVLVAISAEGKTVGSITSIGFKFSEENLSPITEYFTPEDSIKGGD